MRETGFQIAPYQLLNLSELTIRKKINQHATLKIVGQIAEELEDQYADDAVVHQEVSVKALDEHGKTAILFTGIVKTVSIRNRNQVRTLEVEAVSYSYLMDITPHTRSFQNEQQTYKSILETLIKPYPKNGVMMSVGSQETTKQLIMQYRETDWSLALRLASHFNSFVAPEYKVGGVKFYFGMPELVEETLVAPAAYTLKKNVGDYLDKSENQVHGIAEADALYYQVQSREIFDLCQPVNFKNQTLYVYEIVSQLEGAELRHYYSLKKVNGFKTKKAYNHQLIGASVDAKVLDVSKDTVKVQMAVDEKQDTDTAKWFPFSTVYSSPDGSGWYCMPEQSDSMRVYFADEKEENAFVISAVHEQSSAAGKREDPNVKVLSTKHGKQIIFTEKGLEIKSGDGLYIGLLDDEGIIIRSNKSIKIHSTEDMAIGSGSAMSLAAKEGIEIKQGEKTTIELKDDVTVKGGKVKLAEK
jgi:hypothetical protein